MKQTKRNTKEVNQIKVRTTLNLEKLNRNTTNGSSYPVCANCVDYDTTAPDTPFNTFGDSMAECLRSNPNKFDVLWILTKTHSRGENAP